MTGYIRAKLDTALAQEKTDWLNTHPSLRDRIRRARAAKAPGLFRLEGPATQLFSDFDTVARQITFLHYAEDLRIPVLPAALAPAGGV